MIISPNQWIYMKYFTHKHYVYLKASTGIKMSTFLGKMQGWPCGSQNGPWIFLLYTTRINAPMFGYDEKWSFHLPLRSYHIIYVYNKPQYQSSAIKLFFNKNTPNNKTKLTDNIPVNLAMLVYPCSQSLKSV